MTDCYVPSYPGFGDIISTLQYCNLTNKRHITYFNKTQKCNFIDILSLFDNNLIIEDHCRGFSYIKPHWWHTDRIDYIKSNFNVIKKDHIVISLIPASDGIYEYGTSKKLHEENIKKILKKISDNQVINLSDYNIYGPKFIKNHGRDNICTKFKWIASAKLSICVDTGIAHLSAMTHTPTIVIAPPQALNRYNGQSNVYFVSIVEDLEAIYDSLK